MSPPAQKARSPSPRITTARTLGSRRQDWSRDRIFFTMARFRALRLLGRVRVRQAQPFEKVETEIRDSWMVLPEGLWICGCGMEETNEVSREGGMEDEEEVNQLTASFSSSGLIV